LLSIVVLLLSAKPLNSIVPRLLIIGINAGLDITSFISAPLGCVLYYNDYLYWKKMQNNK